MEKLGRDVLTLIAFDLGYTDILKLCQTSKIINKNICLNNDFWRNKLYQDYPISRGSKSENYKKLYHLIELERNKILNSSKFLKIDKLSNYARPIFIRRELYHFIKNTDFGILPNFHYPINFLLIPLLEMKILNRPIANHLFLIYLFKNNLNYIEDGKRYFKLKDDLNVFPLILLYEDNNPSFNRNKFSYKTIKEIINVGIISNKELNKHQISQLKNKEIIEQISKIQPLILETENLYE